MALINKFHFMNIQSKSSTWLIIWLLLADEKVLSLDCFICGQTDIRADEKDDCSPQYPYECAGGTASNSGDAICRTIRHTLPTGRFSMTKECIFEQDHLKLIQPAPAIAEGCIFNISTDRGIIVDYCACTKELCNEASINDQYLQHIFRTSGGGNENRNSVSAKPATSATIQPQATIALQLITYATPTRPALSVHSGQGKTVSPAVDRRRVFALPANEFSTPDRQIGPKINSAFPSINQSKQRQQQLPYLQQQHPSHSWSTTTLHTLPTPTNFRPISLPPVQQRQPPAFTGKPSSQLVKQVLSGHSSIFSSMAFSTLEEEENEKLKEMNGNNEIENENTNRPTSSGDQEASDGGTSVLGSTNCFFCAESDITSVDGDCTHQYELDCNSQYLPGTRVFCTSRITKLNSDKRCISEQEHQHQYQSTTVIFNGCTHAFNSYMRYCICTGAYCNRDSVTAQLAAMSDTSKKLPTTSVSSGLSPNSIDADFAEKSSLREIFNGGPMVEAFSSVNDNHNSDQNGSISNRFHQQPRYFHPAKSNQKMSASVACKKDDSRIAYNYNGNQNENDDDLNSSWIRNSWRGRSYRYVESGSTSFKTAFQRKLFQPCLLLLFSYRLLCLS